MKKYPSIHTSLLTIGRIINQKSVRAKMRGITVYKLVEMTDRNAFSISSWTLNRFSTKKVRTKVDSNSVTQNWRMFLKLGRQLQKCIYKQIFCCDFETGGISCHWSIPGWIKLITVDPGRSKLKKMTKIHNLIFLRKKTEPGPAGTAQ